MLHDFEDDLNAAAFDRQRLGSQIRPIAYRAAASHAKGRTSTVDRRLVATRHFGPKILLTGRTPQLWAL